MSSSAHNKRIVIIAGPKIKGGSIALPLEDEFFPCSSELQTCSEVVKGAHISKRKEFYVENNAQQSGTDHGFRARKVE